MLSQALYVACFISLVFVTEAETVKNLTVPNLPDIPEGLVILHQQIIEETHNNTVTLIV